MTGKNKSDTIFVQGHQPHVLKNYFIDCHLMTVYALTKKIKK